MNIPQFKGKNSGIMNEHTAPLYMLRRTDLRSLIGLYVSEALLLIGFILILLNNLNILCPGSYFGAFSWVTETVFSIGLIINYISIPHLYFSSYNNFNKEDDFWDKETFWILPLFFFGTFFLYGSQIASAWALLTFSIIIISAIHFSLAWSAWKYMLNNSDFSFSLRQQYFTTLKYLTAYYLLLLAIVILCDPLQQMFYWIRMHMS